MRKRKKKKLLVALLIVGGFSVFYSTHGEARQTTEEKWDQYNSVQINPIFSTTNFDSDEGNIEPTEGNNLILKTDFLKIKHIHGEAETGVASFQGFSAFKNLEDVYVEGGGVSDFRPIRNLTNIKRFYMSGTNNNTLIDFEKLNKIEEFSYEHFSDNGESIALTDISALSNKNNLKRIKISVDGNLPKITLSKKNNHYELLKPIVLSDQFKQDVKYSQVYFEYPENSDDDSVETDDFTSDVSKDGLISWQNIPTSASHLTFTASADEDLNYYYGSINIPIRWVD